jgi:apolipoprotein N-acyltransferase
VSLQLPLRYRSGPGPKRLAALFSGAALVLAFEPFALAWLAPVALATLILLLEETTPREAAWTGFCFGLGLFTAGTYWLYISLNIMGGLWPPIALLMMLVFIVILATYSALASYATVRFARVSGVLRWLVLFPAFWTLAEWLRGWMFTGFPWLSVGYSQVETMVRALAPVLGVYGVSWATACIAGLLVCLVRAGKVLRGIALTAGLLVFMVLSSFAGYDWTTATDKELRVSLVQGAVSQDLKWTPEQLEPTLELYRDLTRDLEQRDLVVWPEAAIPALPFEIPEYLQELQTAMVESNTQLFTGILTFDIERVEFKNTLWAIGPDERMYHKRHLVMFGEYFPLPRFVRNYMRVMNLPSENIAEGDADQPLLLTQGVPVAATICYELAFGAEQLPFFPAAQLMVNVSNDAWFGDSIAPHQHLQIGQMRALEVGRYLLRATNTGVTAIVNPRGRVVEQIPQFVPGVLNRTVEAYIGATPYVRWGNWPVISGLLVLAVAAIFIRRAAGRTVII